MFLSWLSTISYYIYIYMFYLYFVVSSLTYINPIKPSLDNSCSPSMFHLRPFLLLGPHGRPMRLGARHVSFDFHPWEKRAKQLPPMGKSITMADSNDPIPYIPSNETMNQTEPNSRRNPYWYHVLQAAHLREVELVPWMFHGVWTLISTALSPFWDFWVISWMFHCRSYLTAIQTWQGRWMQSVMSFHVLNDLKWFICHQFLSSLTRWRRRKLVVCSEVLYGLPLGTDPWLGKLCGLYWKWRSEIISFNSLWWLK